MTCQLKISSTNEMLADQSGIHILNQALWLVVQDRIMEEISSMIGHVSTSIPYWDSSTNKRLYGAPLYNTRYIVIHSHTHGLRTQNESFFLNTPNILANWADLLKLIFNVMCIPSLWFCITKPFFLQKAKNFIHFTVFSIWDMILGCREFWI